MRPTSHILDPCPFWLRKKARGGLIDWLGSVTNAFVMEEMMPKVVKEAVVKPLLKKKIFGMKKIEQLQACIKHPIWAQGTQMPSGNTTPRVSGRLSKYLDPF